ncbi:MAG: SH3 domain-containing protein [Aristaeellaceae bacterium]
MLKRYLALMLTLMLTVGMLTLPTTAAQAASTTATIKGGWLRLRAEPSFDAVTITSYRTGTVVTVLGSQGKWYQVTTPDGRSGYMYGDYLTIGTSSSGSGTNGTWENIAATVVSANGLGVRLRTGPSTAYGVLAVYPVGTAATILSSGTYWHYVRIGNRTGYMMSQFLSSGTTPSKPSNATGYTAYVTSENGLGVRLRKGAGTGYGVLGVYSVGTQVTVLEHNKTWDYIRIGTRTGYMMNKFLTTTAPVTTNRLTGVTLNTAYPTVGTVLKANVLPTGATVTYEWMDNYGTLLSSAAVYTVTTADLGRQIRVRVTGSGSYTGTAVSSWATVQSGTTSAKTPITAVTLNNTAPTAGETITASTTPAGATANFIWYRDDGATLGNGKSYTATAADVGHAIYCAAYATGDYSGNIASYYTDKVKAVAASTEKKITAVTLSNTAPMVGQTITASTTPADATANFIWYRDDGATLGNGKSYTPTTSDVGHAIYCAAYATGAYTGNIASYYTDKVKAAEPAVEKKITAVTLSNTSPTAGQTITASTTPADATANFIWYRDDGVTLGTGKSYTTTASDVGHAIYCAAYATGEYTGNVASYYTAKVKAVAAADKPLSGSVSLPATATVGDILTPGVNVNSDQYAFTWTVDGSAVGSGKQLTLTEAMAGKTVRLTVTAIEGSGYTGSVTSNGCTVVVPAKPDPDPATTTDL